MARSKELAKNTAVLTLGKFSTQLISLFLLPLYTVYLSPKELGFVDLAVTYMALLVPALTIQMEMAGFRFLIDARGDEGKKREVISNVLQVAFGIFALFGLVYALLGRYISIPYENLIFANMGVTIFASIFLQFARGLGDNKRFAIASTLTGIATLIATLLLVVRGGAGAGGVLGALVIANLTSATYLFWSLKLHRYIDLFKGSSELKKKLLHYSLPLVPNGLSWWVISVSDRTIISIFLGLSANGIYAVANKYAAVFASVFAIFSMALTESASVHINAKGGDKFLSDTNSTSMKLFGGFGLLLIVAAPFVFRFLIGPEFQAASQYVPILIVAALLNAAVGIYSAIYVAKKMTKQVATTSVAAAIINIGLTLAFINSLDIYAAALATAMAYGSMAVFRHYDLKKYIKLTYEKNLFIKIGAAYSVVIALYYLQNSIANFVNVAIAAGIALLLNRSTIGSAKSMVFGMLKAKGGKA